MKSYSFGQLWRRPTYLNFVRSEALLVDTDGCSRVSGVKRECCEEHDISYFHGKDPRDAYLRFKTGSVDYWADAKPITRAETDRRFRKCHQARSAMGSYSPMAWWRWTAVRLLGGKPWREHEASRQAPAALDR